MSEYLSLLQVEHPIFVLVMAMMFGLIVGSFLNVVIVRLPVMLDRQWTAQAHEVLGHETDTDQESFNLISPNSHCSNCKTEIKTWQNIPLASYLMLGGKCGNCGISIPMLYPFVELTTGILTVIVIFAFGITLVGLFGCLFTWALIALSVIDFNTKLLPDDITLPFLWLGLSVNFFGVFVNFHTAFIGACAGYLSLWSIYQVFRLVTKKEGMGYGDFKLLALLGAWLGWQPLLLVVILSSFAGVIGAGALILLGRDRANPIPFGPYLAIAGWVTFIWGDSLINWYFTILAVS